MGWNNRVTVFGDITGDIYYDVLQLTNKPLPFLRVYMMINGTRESKEVKGLRIVFYGTQAELAEAQLKMGSRIQVEGHIQLRKIRNEGIVVEVVAEHVVYIRNYDREKGNQRYKEMLVSGKIQAGEDELLELPVTAEAWE
jgi:single-stranded DNA-binding protein